MARFLPSPWQRGNAMDTVQTRYGEIPVAGCLEWHYTGVLMSCAPAGPALLDTPFGALPP